MEKWILLLCLFLGGTTFAAIPKTTIEKFQKRAPDAIEISVTKVSFVSKTDRERPEIQYSVTATVTAVIKSKSGLKEGDVISIFYTRPAKAEPGDYPGKIEKGAKYTAYLKRDRKMKSRFVPAAMSGTFEKRK